MRILYLLLAAFLLLGCAMPTDRTNETNVSNESDSGNVSGLIVDTSWAKHNASGFSFDYPSNMDVQASQGIFAADHMIDGQTGEIFIVVYYNTVKNYGENRDRILKENPSLAASELLEEDLEADPAQVLDKAETVGEVTTYSIARDGYASEVPITVRFEDSMSVFRGYAISVFVPERSLHIKVRVLAKDQSKADDIRKRFISSFRIE